jgi:hypothetical protein
MIKVSSRPKEPQIQMADKAVVDVAEVMDVADAIMAPAPVTTVVDTTDAIMDAAIVITALTTDTAQAPVTALATVAIIIPVEEDIDQTHAIDIPATDVAVITLHSAAATILGLAGIARATHDRCFIGIGPAFDRFLAQPLTPTEICFLLLSQDTSASAINRSSLPFRTQPLTAAILRPAEIQAAISLPATPATNKIFT